MAERAKLHEGKDHVFLLALRLCTLMLLVALLTIHLRSVRVFRWEQSVSGGVLVTYCAVSLGLALCAGADKCDGMAFQTYLCGAGAALLAVNAASIWQRWRRANDLTRAVAELLQSLGIPLKRQVIIKVSLSAAAAVGLLLDLALAPVFRAKST